MINVEKKYNVVVVGAGHAGCEAALVAARMGMQTLLITMDISNVAKMSCNPAIGGLAKGHLVREIDALGGEMALAIDDTGIQFRMLNKSKGPAVWSPRAQADRIQYSLCMLKAIESQPKLELKQSMVVDLIVDDNRIVGVKLFTGSEVKCDAVILTNGTFLNGLIHIGMFHYEGGRAGEFPAKGLTENLQKLGFRSGRLKTGTPPRIDGRTIDFSKTTIQPGDEIPQPFSYQTQKIERNQVPCYLTTTTDVTHKIIHSGFDRSPMFTGKIVGIGPRYCPSIETKIDRFPDRSGHQIYLEPEGLNTSEYYVNGFATSLPEDIQIRALRTIPGLENVEIMRLGYAIEYDFFYPDQLKPTLETKRIHNLFFAGQINGTSGYEEAAALGLMAGINASLNLQNKEPFVLKRDQAYIGVLIDDLVTKEIEEPYRMFTSLAEYRLLLRQDNADLRLTDIGYQFGLISDERYLNFKQKKQLINQYIDELKKIRIDLDIINPFLETQQSSLLNEKESIYVLLRRPELDVQLMIDIVDIPLFKELKNGNPFYKDVARQIEIEIKYEGYLDRQRMQIEKSSKFDDQRIPDEFDYTKIVTLSTEAKEKLNRIQPKSIGQASRIAGVSPSDIATIMIMLKRHQNVSRETSDGNK
ncbi:tRNA uridine-5-carboxymethylaminomethyl(34) synthesis enzyme MnmG [candidate division KSB1 bacterium]|nr:tRNA uridine-5-carboxymethylaminomethyl(34) synthesis enzyme MnmG [candidate division KSB1 bacterium]